MPIRQPNEDLFEDSRMSFGEHLEELRKVFVRALVGIAIGCVGGFLIADKVVIFLSKPLNTAIENFRFENAKEKLRLKNDGILAPELQLMLADKQLAPRTVFIDPGQIVNLLREQSSDALSEINIKPYCFIPADLKTGKAVEFCRRLENQSDDGNSAQTARLEYLWSQLPNDLKSKVNSIADAESAEGHVSDAFLILNELAENSAAYSADEFSELLKESTKEWWEFFKELEPNPLFKMKQRIDEAPSQDAIRRLNRLLISSVFPDQLNPPSIPFSSIEIWESIASNPQSLTAPEGFMIWMKAGLITGLFLSSPWIFLQLWTFISAGLYPHEQKYVYIYLPFSLILFFAGACLAFFFVFEPVLNFLFKFNASMGIDPQPRIGDWLSFVMFLPLGFGVAFQLPLVMFFVNRFGLMSVETFITKWRMAILVICVLSMILTPSDPISMIMLAVPLTLLYFLGIAMCKWMPQGGRNPYDEAYEP